MEDKIPTNTSNNKGLVQFYAMKGNIWMKRKKFKNSFGLNVSNTSQVFFPIFFLSFSDWDKRFCLSRKFKLYIINGLLRMFWSK
jgi:hypothetical protein